MSSSDSSFSEQCVSPLCVPLPIHELRRTLFLLLLLSSRSGSLGRTTSSGSWGSSRRRSGARATANVHEHVLDILALERLGEEGGPDGLDVRDLGGRDERLKLVGLQGEAISISKSPIVHPFGSVGAYGDLDTIISQDEGGVGSCELGGRHCDFMSWWVGVVEGNEMPTTLAVS